MVNVFHVGCILDIRCLKFKKSVQGFHVTRDQALLFFVIRERKKSKLVIPEWHYVRDVTRFDIREFVYYPRKQLNMKKCLKISMISYFSFPPIP